MIAKTEKSEIMQLPKNNKTMKIFAEKTFGSEI